MNEDTDNINNDNDDIITTTSQLLEQAGEPGGGGEGQAEHQGVRVSGPVALC